MTNTDIKRIGIHECCHAVLARLFRRKMAIEGIFVSRELVEKRQDQGALNLRGPSLNSEQDYIALAITYLAGVVGENMYLLGVGAIKEKKEEILADDKIMDWSTAGGDLPSFHHVAQLYSLFYQNDEKALKEFSLGFLIDFLSDKKIWSIVEKLCHELIEKEDLKMSEDELDSFFGQIGSDELLDNKCDEIQKE